MGPPQALDASQARRTVLAAQGLAHPRPAGRVDRRHLRKLLDRLRLVQLDSVNVLARAHYVPAFSRLGIHDATLLDRLAYDGRELFEYWGHVASLVVVDHEPDLRWRMAQDHQWKRPGQIAARRPDLVDALEAEVLAGGPLSARDFRDRLGDAPNGSPWWGWDDTKLALEYLFWTGRVGALRRGNFERVYCHPDLAVPPEIRARPTPDEETAKRRLLLTAARAHGIGTARDLADYWRLKVPESARLLRAMAADGELEVVDVQGWPGPVYRHPAAPLPRRVDARALVSPFDVAMWERDRVERVHGFEYRIEIYVPEPARRYGYYVLPFLLGDTFVARVDLKADRPSATLLVRSAHAEPDLAARGTDTATVAAALTEELRLLARWLRLERVVVEDRGDLAPPLRAEVGRVGV